MADGNDARRYDRRDVLQAGVVGTTIGVAGCLRFITGGSGGSGESTDDGSNGSGDADSGTASGDGSGGASSDGSSGASGEADGGTETATEPAGTTVTEETGGAWPLAQYDPANTGHVTEYSGPTGEPSVAWRYDTDGTTKSSPVVADGTVYAAVWDHPTAVGADGTEAWTGEEEPGKCNGAPAIADGTVIVGYGDDTSLVAAYDAADGTRQWESNVGGVATSPIVVEDTVYVTLFGDDGGGVAALSLSDGTTKWQQPTEDPVIAAPAVHDGTVYVGDQDAFLYAFDAADGTKQWQVETDPGKVSTVVATDDHVFTAGFVFSVAGHDAESGDLLWEKGGNNPEIAVADGTVFRAQKKTDDADDAPLDALSASDGSVEWATTGEDFAAPIEEDFSRTEANAAPTVADGTVFASVGSRVYALDAATGEIAWGTPESVDADGSPNVVGERLYLTSDGDVVVLE